MRGITPNIQNVADLSKNLTRKWPEVLTEDRRGIRRKTEENVVVILGQ